MSHAGLKFPSMFAATQHDPAPRPNVLCVAENSRLGFGPTDTTTFQNCSWPNSETLLGIEPPLRRAHSRPRTSGKERDSESGLDNFGARYDSSQYGRFMTPDWNALPSPVPFSDLTNPQSLNLYAYVRNNPLSLVDPDGHDCVYLNDSGGDVESVDHHSNSGECKDNGGAWAEGYVVKSNVAVDSNSNQVLIGSNLSLTASGVSGNLTVGTPGQASDTSPLTVREFLSRGPDFIQFSLSVGIPYLLNIVGPTANLNLDRNGNVYLSGGVAVGKTLWQVAGSVTANDLYTGSKPSPSQLNSFLTGNSFSFTAGVWAGVQGGWTPGSGYSVGVGVVSPQVGGAWTYGGKIGSIGSKWGW